MKRVLHQAVLRTRRTPGLRSLYRAIYGGAVAGAARSLYGLNGVSSVYLHRGLTREGWEPGVSDIDLLVLREDELEGGEGEFLARFSARLAALRRPFPMLGDLWLGTPEEARHYLRWGGLRAWEDAPDWKLLCGGAIEIPALRESQLKKRWLDPWVWLFISYMEICRRTFGPRGELALKSDADLRKIYLDVLRLSNFLSEGAGALLPRAAQRERSPEALRLSSRDLWLDAALRLSRASRLVLSRAASENTALAQWPAAPPKSPAHQRLKALVGAVPGARGAVCDEPYHTYLLLGDGASARDYDRAAAGLLKHPQAGVAMVLEAPALFLAMQSSYLGAPLGWLGSGSGGASAGGRALFPDWGACAYGQPLPAAALLPERLRWETAAEAASWMLLWWRSLWIGAGWSNRFVLYHLYTRALALGLLLDGQASGPFCDWELLGARRSARVKSLLEGESAANLDCRAREALAPGHLPALAGLMAGLSAALKAPASR